MTSFRRKEKVDVSMALSQGLSPSSDTSKQPSLLGSKPWLNSQSLVSTGLRQLDNILGGGLALGSIFHIDEDDQFGLYSDIVMGYSIAESISTGCITLLVVHDAFDSSRILSSLPYNLSIKDVDCSQSVEEIPQAPPEVLVTEPTTELKIAWQYEKYLNNDTNPIIGKPSITNKSSTKNLYCCSYDLSNRLQSSLTSKSPVYVLSRGERPLAVVVDEVAAFIEMNSKSNRAIRVFIPHLGGISCHEQRDAQTILLSLLQLKQIVYGVNNPYTSLVLTTHKSFLGEQLSSSIVRLISDLSISLDSLAGKYQLVAREFGEFLGFLSINKIQHTGQLASIRPLYARYGLKRDRRKLYIEPLHLPPEEGEKGRGESVSKPVSISSKVQLKFEVEANDSEGKKSLEIETVSPAAKFGSPVKISSFRAAGSTSAEAVTEQKRSSLAAAINRVRDTKAACGSSFEGGNLDF